MKLKNICQAIKKIKDTATGSSQTFATMIFMQSVFHSIVLRQMVLCTMTTYQYHLRQWVNSGQMQLTLLITFMMDINIQLKQTKKEIQFHIQKVIHSTIIQMIQIIHSTRKQLLKMSHLMTTECMKIHGSQEYRVKYHMMVKTGTMLTQKVQVHHLQINLEMMVDLIRTQMNLTKKVLIFHSQCIQDVQM